MNELVDNFKKFVVASLDYTYGDYKININNEVPWLRMFHSTTSNVIRVKIGDNIKLKITITEEK